MKPDVEGALLDYLDTKGLSSAWVTAGEIAGDDKKLRRAVSYYCTTHIKASRRKRVAVVARKKVYPPGARGGLYILTFKIVRVCKQ